MNETEHNNVSNGRTSPPPPPSPSTKDQNSEDIVKLKEELMAADERNNLLSAEFKRLKLSLKKSNARLVMEKTNFKKNLSNLAENLNAFENGLRSEQRSISLALSRKENEIKARDETIKALQTELQSVRRCSECMSLISSNPDHIIPNNNEQKTIDSKQQSTSNTMLLSQSLSLDLTPRPTRSSRKQVFAHHHRNNLSDLSPVVEEAEVPAMVDRQQYASVKDRLPVDTSQEEQPADESAIVDASLSGINNGIHNSLTEDTDLSDKHNVSNDEINDSISDDHIQSSSTTSSLYYDYVDIESNRETCDKNAISENVETSKADGICTETVTDSIEQSSECSSAKEEVTAEEERNEHQLVNAEHVTKEGLRDIESDMLNLQLQDNTTLEENNTSPSEPVCSANFESVPEVTPESSPNSDERFSQIETIKTDEQAKTINKEESTKLDSIENHLDTKCKENIQENNSNCEQSLIQPASIATDTNEQPPSNNNIDVTAISNNNGVTDDIACESDTTNEKTVKSSTEINHTTDEANSDGSGTNSEMASHEGSVECEGIESQKKSKSGDKGLDEYDVIELDDGSSASKNPSANRQKGNSKKKKNKNKRKSKGKK